MAALEDLTAVIEEYHRALGVFVTGSPEALQDMYSQQDDVSLANPFGPPTRGWNHVNSVMAAAASSYRDGEVIGFDYVAGCVTAELAYIVEIERYEVKVGGRETAAPVALRVTSVFRPEGGTWKVTHRHADTITTVRPPESVLQA